MKKVLSFMGCAMIVAAMTISCGGNKTEATEAENEVITEAVEAATDEAVVEAPTMSDADHQAMLDAAAEAGRAKCECYKKDAASVEACIKSILQQSYAAYEGNDEFKEAMEAEFNSCVKEKVAAAAKEKAEEGASKLAGAISDKLSK